MKTLSEQIAAADLFARTARFHLDNPRPEYLDQVRQKLLDALGAMETLLEESGAAVDPSYARIEDSGDAIEVLHNMVEVASIKAA